MTSSDMYLLKAEIYKELRQEFGMEVARAQMSHRTFYKILDKVLKKLAEEAHTYYVLSDG